MIQLSCKNRKFNGVIELTRSKSESNRALMIQALCQGEIDIEHLASADDTQLLAKALKDYTSQDIINVGHAGTSFRFLTAFLSTRKEGYWLLTGSKRMKERPIGILVEALKQIGANIQYEEKEGFPPLRISGGVDLSNSLKIDGGVSSQYVSALLLVAPTLPKGLEIDLIGEITSRPYLEMTISMMAYFGVKVNWENQVLKIESQPYNSKSIEIEGDWSAASYWYGFVALAEVGSSVYLKGLNQESLQGDAILKEIYTVFGVQSTFQNGGWWLEKVTEDLTKSFTLDLNMAPDIAQTILCTCAGLGMGVSITGLHTLKIKETDRVAAMQNELSKFGIELTAISDDEIKMKTGQILNSPLTNIETYQDHRMAMAFATLAMKTDLQIENPEVVSKSYPKFWEDVKKNIIK
jgi:3-phosphoshikimate 1-carboxyvinyltransferase